MQVDPADVAPRQAALVHERAHDVSRGDPLPLADPDPVERQPRPAVPVGALRAVAVAGTALRARLRVGLQQQRLLALPGQRERGGDVQLGDVVLADVVGDHLPEELQPG